MRGRNARSVVAGVAAVALLWSATAATAASTSDPDDLEGVLDLRSLSIVRAASSDPMDITIGFWSDVAVADLANATGNVLKVQWDVDRNGTADFWGRIRRTGAVLSIAIQEGGSNRFEPLPVSRVGARSLAFTVPGSAPMNPTHDLAVRVVVRTQSGADRSRWLVVGASGGGGGGGGGGSGVPADCRRVSDGVVTVVAEGVAYTEGSCIRVTAGAAFTIRFDDRDLASMYGQHNIAIFGGTTATPVSIFTGELVSGPGMRLYAIPALDAGRYSFRCTIHPNMEGRIYSVAA